MKYLARGSTGLAVTAILIAVALSMITPVVSYCGTEAGERGQSDATVTDFSAYKSAGPIAIALALTISVLLRVPLFRKNRRACAAWCHREESTKLKCNIFLGRGGMEAHPSLSSLWQLCLTCDFWNGQRMPSHYGDRVEFDYRDVKGKCMEDSWNGQHRTLYSACNKWKEWSFIKTDLKNNCIERGSNESK